VLSLLRDLFFKLNEPDNVSRQASGILGSFDSAFVPLRPDVCYPSASTPPISDPRTLT